MGVTRRNRKTKREQASGWLLLLFTLSARRAAKRVEIWRRLQRYGALTFRSSGYILPNNPTNKERFEWLAQSIRKLKGHASVVELVSIDDVPEGELKRLFNQARAKDYQSLLRELAKPRPGTAQLLRLRRKLQDISDIDFFGCPQRSKVEAAISAMENPVSSTKEAESETKRTYRRRVWVTRPRPGIDRVSSAWLIRNHIDDKARFDFINDPSEMPGCVPFDLFDVGGFTHEGDSCTFETLCKHFGLRDRKLKVLAEIIHDADLDDGKFGRDEGSGLDKVLNGWAQQDFSDHDLLQMGMQMIEGLYRSIR